MNIDTADKIIEFIAYYNSFFKDLDRLLAQKERRVIGDDLNWLLESLNKEQTMIMQINSLEQRRVKLFEQLGCPGFTSRQLIDNCPPERQGRMITECSALENHIDSIKKHSASIMDLVERKLSIASKISGVTNPSTASVYNVSGKKVSGHFSSEYIGDI